MSLYREIQGYTFQSLSSDPSPAVPGQIWYNTTTNTVKSSKLVGTWATANSMGSPRQGSAAVGIQTAALAIGSVNPTAGLTEKYDGTNWTSATAAPYATGVSAAGTQTAALAFSGGPLFGSVGVATTAKYDGTNWTVVNSMNTARLSIAGCGTQNAALACSGNISGAPIGPAINAEAFDGTNWTAVSNMNFDRREAGAGAFGTQTAALAMGGFQQPNTQFWQTESYNGISWTNVNNMNQQRGKGASFFGSAGTQTLGLVFGGSTPVPTSTEQWTETAWYFDSSTLPVGSGAVGCGTQTSAVSFGDTGCVEWDYTGVSTNTITIS